MTDVDHSIQLLYCALLKKKAHVLKQINYSNGSIHIVYQYDGSDLRYGLTIGEPNDWFAEVMCEVEINKMIEEWEKK